MRITGGKARGIQLKCPLNNIRPAADKIRESIFSSLGPSIKSSNCIDLFAGTGSYGLEALSRGALYCSFYEKNSIDHLSHNIKSVAKSAKLKNSCFNLLKIDLLKSTITKPKPKIDFIFLDPPYELLDRESSFLLDDLAYKLADLSTTLILESPSGYSLKTKNWLVEKKYKSNSKGKPSITKLIPIF